MVLYFNRCRLAAGMGIVALLITLVLLFLFRSYPPPQPKVPVRPGPKQVYGEFLTWNQVKGLFPRYAAATVTDVDSKLQFRVQRRGGSSHADVQPLTRTDTATMKTIYHNRWSWKRRAVIVQLQDGRKIAASMNGMPHGQGAITGNDFPGHFCIHFRDSKTHGSRKVDLAHQMMIWKAAGRFEQQLALLSPEDCIRVFFVAIDQGEWNLATSMVETGQTGGEVFKQLQRAEAVSIYNIRLLSDKSYNVTVNMILRPDGKQEKREILITVGKPGIKTLVRLEFKQ